MKHDACAHEGCVLIVDDHPVIRESLREVIEQEWPAIEVLESADGEQGIAVACARTPRVAVLDIAMPRTSGLEAARRIHAARPGVHIVILTQYDNEAYRAEARAAGAAAYILKNRAHAELLPTLDRLLAVSA